MAAKIATVPPPSGGVYRLARTLVEPFTPPDWALAHDDGTFGNRFDDPSATQGNPTGKRFRSIYCATQRVATFGETIARFRPSISLLSHLEAIDDDEPIAESFAGVVDPQHPQRGLIPADWRMRRRIGHTILEPTLSFVDLANGDTMQYLRAALASLADELNIADIDLSSLTSQQRRFTQCCARSIYDQVDDSGRSCFAGIRYLSRLDLEWECWAIFDDRIRHVEGYPEFAASFSADDADLMRVARRFHLTIEMFAGQGHYIRP